MLALSAVLASRRAVCASFRAVSGGLLIVIAGIHAVTVKADGPDLSTDLTVLSLAAMLVHGLLRTRWANQGEELRAPFQCERSA